MSQPDGMYMRRTAMALAMVVSMILAVGQAGCSKSGKEAQAGGSPSTAVSSSHTGLPPASPPSNSGGPADWCALTERLATESGLMVNKHFISPLKETMDMFKAAVASGLAHRAELSTGLPANLKAAVDIQMAYFQQLQDSNFQNTEFPAGLTEALDVINKFQTEVCGFVFDK